jgi:hypothetical protein
MRVQVACVIVWEFLFLCHNKKENKWRLCFISLEWLSTQDLYWWNPAKLNKRKAPKKGREKKGGGKDQSPGKQTGQKGFVEYPTY